MIAAAQRHKADGWADVSKQCEQRARSLPVTSRALGDSRSRLARLPAHEVARQTSAQRPADDCAACRRKRDTRPRRCGGQARERVVGERCDERHERSVHCTEQPRLACASRRVAARTPIGGIPRGALVRAIADLKRVIRFLAALGTLEYECVPFPELHCASPAFRARRPCVCFVSATAFGARG